MHIFVKSGPGNDLGNDLGQKLKTVRNGQKDACKVHKGDCQRLIISLGLPNRPF